MAKKNSLSIAVVCGGPSREADVSRVSGRGVAEALSSTYSNVSVIELDCRIGETLKKTSIDVVFPVLHGSPGEDGTLQGLLEIIGMPYVGSGVLASACAMDKVVAKQIFKVAGLPLSKDVIVYRQEGASRAAKQVLAALGPDVVIKPADSGSGLGVLFSRDFSTPKQALEKAFTENERLLVEKRISGREITVGILERNNKIEALPILEVRTPPGSWYDYEHRYTPGLSEHIIPAPLPKTQYKRTQEVALSAFKSLGCRDLARVDFVVPNSGEPVLLEVNTLPGMTPTSLYPDTAKAAGIAFGNLVAHLVERAVSRSKLW